MTAGDSAGRSPLYASDGHVRAWLLVPVQTGGRTLGVLAERRRLANSPAVEGQIRTLTGQDMAVYFTNRHRDIWTDLGGRPVAAPFRRLDTLPEFALTPAGGAPLFGASAGIPSTPWMIVLTLPQAEVLERPRELLERMVGVGFALLLCGVWGAWLVGRRVARPLGALTLAAEQAAQGDFRQRVPITRMDELGRLAQTFNTMAERIGGAHDELTHRAETASELAAALARRNHELDEARMTAIQAVHRTERLQAATAALAGALDLQTIASVFMREGPALSGASAGGVYLLSADSRSLEPLRIAHSDLTAAALDVRIDLDESPIGDVLRRRAPFYATSSVDVGAHPAGVPLASRLAGRAWAALPLMTRDRVRGVLILSFAEPQEFSAALRGSIEALATQCGEATERILWYEEAVHARMAAEAANNAKSRFLALMSHELRTPLNAIGGYVDLMQLGLRGPVTDAQRVDLAKIQRSKQHLLSIINDLLDHSQLEAGRMTLRLAPTSLHDVLLEAESVMAPHFVEKGLQLDTTGCATDAIVRADRVKLCQVLTNLLANALRFTEPGGTIRIACETTPPRVQVRVVDTGIGIPPERCETIFEPFTQVDTGLTRRAGGTGLGLAISRQLTEAMEGTLIVESVLGAGSTFVVSLPLLPAGELPPSMAAPELRHAQHEGGSQIIA
jgi:signal transduction histidine kinase